MKVSVAKEMVGKVNRLNHYKLHVASKGEFTDDYGSVVAWVEFVGIDREIGAIRIITAYSNGKIIWNPVKTDLDRLHSDVVVL